MVIGEIVPAFKGISEKIVPDAKTSPRLPCCFPFAPNAVLLGFISSFIGGIVGLGILALLNNTSLSPALILPGVIPHFFCGATAGVFADATGRQTRNDYRFICPWSTDYILTSNVDACIG